MSSPSIINRLSPATIHKIAAGEVIERPANAVKELVENALDAGATKISIALEEGGLDLIKVGDNGSGMIRADALIAWLPHTTSKINAVEDLEHVASYGFRGEALCSMAAVAEVTIETRHASEATGVAVAVSDSAHTGTREISRNPGTTITVKNLFLHNPARRKFMGSPKTELARILAMVSRVALAHPGVAFRISDRGKDILSLAEGSLKNRVGEILGFNITNELAPLDWTDGTVHVEGYVCTPQQARLRSTHQYFYINRRNIHSGLLARALSQSYDALPPGRFPMAAIYLTMPTEEVDVNVHPTKKEVRFLNESRIYWSINQAVKDGLRRVISAPELDLSPLGNPQVTSENPDGRVANAGASTGGESVSLAAPFLFSGAVTETLREPGNGFQTDAGEMGSPSPMRPVESGERISNQIRLFPISTQNAYDVTTRPVATTGSAIPNSYAAQTPQTQLGPMRAESQARPRAPEIPYLQLHHGFILFGVESGLMMVNQQAAHERILYEKALEDMRRPGRFSSQQLLFPEVLEMSPGDSLFLEQHLDQIQALGFDLESFGGNAFQLRGLPMEVRPDQAKRLVFEMVQGLLRPERAGGAKHEEFQMRLARVYARVTSVKLGEPMEYAQVSALIDGLFATQNPYVSPSGSPIVVRLSMDEIHRKFGLNA